MSQYLTACLRRFITSECLLFTTYEYDYESTENGTGGTCSEYEIDAEITERFSKMLKTSYWTLEELES